MFILYGICVGRRSESMEKKVIVVRTTRRLAATKLLDFAVVVMERATTAGDMNCPEDVWKFQRRKTKQVGD